MRQLTRRLPLLFVAVAATALLAACAGDDEEPARSLQVSMQDIAYSNTALTASAGEHIRIVLDNKGEVTHDFTIDRMPMQGLHTMGGASGGEHQNMNMSGDDRAMHLALDKGKSGWLEFEATEPGTYEFYCTVAGHRDAGMHGTLTVE